MFRTSDCEAHERAHGARGANVSHVSSCQLALSNSRLLHTRSRTCDWRPSTLAVDKRPRRTNLHNIGWKVMVCATCCSVSDSQLSDHLPRARLVRWSPNRSSPIICVHAWHMTTRGGEPASNWRQIRGAMETPRGVGCQITKFPYARNAELTVLAKPNKRRRRGPRLGAQFGGPLRETGASRWPIRTRLGGAAGVNMGYQSAADPGDHVDGEWLMEAADDISSGRDAPFRGVRWPGDATLGATISC